MPATYAHYRFGCDVLKKLPERFHLSDKQNNQLFMIGLHGPDILFFYQPYHWNPVREHGIDLHQRIASSFFARALSTINSFESPRDREAAISYIYGVICHYALDKSCHPYIYNVTDEGTFTHSLIESEFDRILLTGDGFDPVGRILTDHILPSPFNARIIAKFYPVTDSVTLFKVLKSFKFYNNMLSAPKGWKRNFVSALLRLSGHYTYLSGMMISLNPNPKLNEINHTLLKLYEEAIPVAIKLINELEENLNGSLPLDREYDHTFGRD